MKTYMHKVHYYETDKMGITHHSNYIRWMEEARIDFLDQIGWGYDKLEEEGIISPVVSVECDYKSPTHFAEDIQIDVTVKEFKGVRLVIGYNMTRPSDGATVAKATSSHCFVDINGRPIILKRSFPEFFNVLVENVVEE